MSKKNKNYLIAIVMAALTICTIIYAAGGQEYAQNQGLKHNQQRIYRIERKMDNQHKLTNTVLNQILKEVSKR